MIRLEFPWKYGSGKLIVYTIIQETKGSPYFFYAKDTLIGSLDKADGFWIQVSGRQTLDSMIEEMGMFIQEQINLSTLPNEIIHNYGS